MCWEAETVTEDFNGTLKHRKFKRLGPIVKLSAPI